MKSPVLPVAVNVNGISIVLVESFIVRFPVATKPSFVAFTDEEANEIKGNFSALKNRQIINVCLFEHYLYLEC